MTNAYNPYQTELIARLASYLDIPDYIYEDATVKYEDVGAWLIAEDSPLKEYSPEVYPQGSFRLGTVIRPITEKDEYDIDFVCELNLQKEQTTQAKLKEKIGDRLKKRSDLAKMLEELGRCWRLNFPDEASMLHFHIDILPSIGNPENPPSGILLTDNELLRWQKSDPIAYANWFYGRMQTVFRATKAKIAESRDADVEDVPDWQVKTPLQRAVQLLKRHRDIYFQKDTDSKPASIIVTTLAALAYRGQTDNYAALAEILRDMQGNIEVKNGKWWIANPVEPDENFADKWYEHPERKRAFDRWLVSAATDFASLARQPLGIASKSTLEKAVGRSVAENVLSKSLSSNQRQILVPNLGSTQHILAPQWPISNRYKAKVKGVVYREEYAKKAWDLTDRPVPKNFWLKFTLYTNTPAPYEVQWQIVNTGEEAIRADCLRGDFYTSDSISRDVRWERTLYKGTHYVEAFVIKGGNCVARSGKTMVRVR